jgi:radical SAM protein
VRTPHRDRTGLDEVEGRGGLPLAYERSACAQSEPFLQAAARVSDSRLLYKTEHRLDVLPWRRYRSDMKTFFSEISRERLCLDRAPRLVYWEATRACELACVHCRAEAIPHRHPLELSTHEAKALFRQIATFSADPKRLPHLVITGGDPLQRPDLFDLIEYGRGLGLPISVTPAGTPRLNPQTLRQFKEVGIRSLALSLDGSDASRHDAFRGVRGSFRWTLAATRSAQAQRIPLQINTMVTADTLEDLPRLYHLVSEVGVSRWALFFLISVGRGRQLEEITPRQCERLLHWLCDLAESPETSFALKTTEAHHFRRIVYLRMRARGLEEEAILQTPIGRSFGVRDGNGIVFISHLGQIYPSGFLPLSAGDVRQESLMEIYCHSELFCALRDADRLKGKCGHCPFRAICGGSRARAYAATGDPLESDPLCLYQPRTR